MNIMKTPTSGTSAVGKGKVNVCVCFAQEKAVLFFWRVARYYLVLWLYDLEQETDVFSSIDGF